MNTCLKIIVPVVLLILITSVLPGCQSTSSESTDDSNLIGNPENTADVGSTVTQETNTEDQITEEPMPIHPSSTNSTLQLTPIEKMGITGIAQEVDIDEYRLVVEGLVATPLSLTYQDVLSYPSVTDIGVINCPDFFVDIGEWTGVPVRTLLTEAGVTPDAVSLTFYALDGYNHTLSLEHIDKYSVFLAYIVNGETLPPEHGYPLRVVDDGSTGSAWVKWVTRMEVN